MARLRDTTCDTRLGGGTRLSYVIDCVSGGQGAVGDVSYQTDHPTPPGLAMQNYTCNDQGDSRQPMSQNLDHVRKHQLATPHAIRAVTPPAAQYYHRRDTTAGEACGSCAGGDSSGDASNALAPLAIMRSVTTTGWVIPLVILSSDTAGDNARLDERGKL